MPGSGLRIIQSRDSKVGAPRAGSGGVDAVSLQQQLTRTIRGDVRFDAGSRALYATDGSNYRQTPIGVVLPRDSDDVVATVEACRRFGAPLLARGAATSLAGQCCNVAVILDFTRYMNRVIEIDPQKRLARCEPGTINDTLRNAARKYGLTFGPDPATHAWCTIGGNIGNNSCGVHSQISGRTADNVHELEVLTYDGTRMRVGKTDDTELRRIIGEGGRRGEIYSRLRQLRDRYANFIYERFPDIPRRVSGYCLEQLLPECGFHVARALVGSESTCAITLEATLNLIEWPAHQILLALGYPDIYAAGDHVAEIGQYGPMGLEAIDEKFVTDLRKKRLQLDNLSILPAGRGWSLVEFGGATKEEAAASAQRLIDHLNKSPNPPTMRLVQDDIEMRRIWEVRESGLGATSHIPGEDENWEGWEDAAVPPEHVGTYLRRMRKLLDRYGYVAALYGHLGQGCVHGRINFDMKSAAGVAKYRAFVHEAADLVVSLGGSLSGEHGDGQARAELLPKMFGPELIQAFEEFKSIWDPQWKMNPGKLVRPFRVDENLRFGPHYQPKESATHFQFPGDGFSFAKATERCVGVGKCRRESGGTMCPSFMATREELHSTRGRARLLFEMLRGDPLTGGWRNKAVKKALDLCLSCKGCKSDCPVQVDMATYKAEFLSHYYKGRPRPRQAYLFGLIHFWSRLASRAPAAANFFTQMPGIASLTKLIAGVARKRKLPAFANQTFRQWFEKHHEPGRMPSFAPAGGDATDTAPTSAVLLWVDTFTNFFHPHIATAATNVLEKAGFEVFIPPRDLCCGRPLYDYGMLRLARKSLVRIVNSLRPWIQRGLPLVVLEPSCAAVFRDELPNMLPHDLDAIRLSKQTVTISQFLAQCAPDLDWPKLNQSIYMHPHCHHKAVVGVDTEKDVLANLSARFECPPSGCCGMAGAFGFEAGEHYDVSLRCAEQELLPNLKGMPDDWIVAADGFSCREQIRQLTGRRALHTAEILEKAAFEHEARLATKRIRTDG